MFAGLSKDQKNLLQDYSFKQHTFLPSTFAKQQLNSKQPTEHTQVEVIYGEYDEFFEKIVEDIEGKLQDGRATLIVFADKPKMDRCYEKSQVDKLDVIRTFVLLYFTLTSDHFCRFSAAIGKRNPDHPEYASALELKDGLDLDERTTIVLQVLLPFWMITMLLAVASLYVLMLESKIGHTSTQSHPDDTCLWTRHGFRLPRCWASEEWSVFSLIFLICSFLVWIFNSIV